VFWWREQRDGYEWAFTDRVGGVSSGAYEGLDLAAHVGDADDDVAENRRRVAAALEVAEVVYLDQVHGSDVAVVEARPPAPVTADAVVTTTPGLALAAMVADCTPVLLAAADGSAVAAVHAGRPGLAAGVVPAAVAALRDLGARDLRAAVGPSVCGRCYEVPVAMRDEVSRVAPASHTVSWTGTPALDIAAGVVEQLRGLDVEVEWVRGCTREEPDLYSHRRDRATGRFAGLVVRR
jgi:YfiH family protein